MEKGLITLIVPCYNVGKTLEYDDMFVSTQIVKNISSYTNCFY